MRKVKLGRVVFCAFGNIVTPPGESSGCDAVGLIRRSGSKRKTPQVTLRVGQEHVVGA